jgi:transposase
MAAAYSMDLRSLVLKDADAGLSSKELAERYHVSRAWVDALKQRRRETGSIAPRPQRRFRQRVLAGQEQRLAALVCARRAPCSSCTTTCLVPRDGATDPGAPVSPRSTAWIRRPSNLSAAVAGALRNR